ncbi:tol-pal system-associated acyl-CoA thioesterase [Methyloferula stellata]|uniref:tol-pal system-associated acyl-CoA thioesterase n=1 Tax=Methyloferula stellata TaxID=876270 RepID=UPI00036BD34E|nr:tol-pal system-associated acyl-CoA thioesterase [Methyloferula stellata]
MTSSVLPAAKPGLLPLRVYYEDTDFSGSVYHASYLRFLERGRTELLRARGVDQSVLFAGEAGVASYFVVRAMSLDFLKPARMDDELIVETIIADLGGASIKMDQRILRKEDILLAAKVKIALVAEGRARRLPADLTAKLAGHAV